ncbi:MAG TPA: hypothetical protein VEJ47_13705 [Candidatus Eremiobacteraceae bacterium]|nr:hypothetical protein [Candidatus Eremiobacteraceae bacterium]
MAKGASARDAQLILQLYDLRREAEMRKARNWWMTEFWPNNADDFLKVAYATGTQENNWLRQVGGYWGIATSFVLEGALSEELFLKPAFSGEMFVMFAKVYPFLGELREKLGEPEALEDIEKVIMRTKWGRERLKFMLKRLEMWRERMKQKNAEAANAG